MVYSHFEIPWADNSGSGLGSHPITNDVSGLDKPVKQAAINQQRLRSNILGLWIKKFLTTETKRKLSTFSYANTFKTQDDGAAMSFVIVKMVWSETCAVCLDIKSKVENMNMSQFKQDAPKDNMQIAKWTHEISISGETYSEILSNKLNLYSTSSFPLFKEYMYTRRSDWEEDKDLTSKKGQGYVPEEV